MSLIKRGIDQVDAEHQFLSWLMVPAMLVGLAILGLMALGFELPKPPPKKQKPPVMERVGSGVRSGVKDFMRGFTERVHQNED